MNINELKARLQNLNKRTNKQNDLFKPRDEHDVRLIKNGKSGEDPFVTRAFHYNIGDQISILCPKVNFGDECAICDFADTLRAWKDENGRDKPEKVRQQDFEIFKKIQAVSKLFVPVVERVEGGGIGEPKWWGLTQNQAGQIVDVCTDTDRLAACDIDANDAEKAIDAVFSPKKAFDLHVSFAKPGEKGNTKSFTQVTIKAKFKVSPLTGDAKKDAELSAKVRPIEEVFPKSTSAEVELALKKFVGDGMKTATTEGGQERYSSNSGENAAKSGGRKVEEAFDEILAGGKK